MEKRIICQCPCGYGFEAFCSEDEAVALVQLHMERFHKDLLPFGITHAEVLTMLKIEFENEVKAPKGIFYYTTTSPSANIIKTTIEKMQEKNKSTIMENPQYPSPNQSKV